MGLPDSFDKAMRRIRFMRGLRLSFVAAAAAAALHVQAHEFWMYAHPFNTPVNGKSELSLHVGEQFAGERLPFTQPYVAGLTRYSCGTRADVLPDVPQGLSTMGLAIQLACPGVHLWAMDSHPNKVNLSADKFEAYLHAEGLGHISEARKADGRSESPGRERYQRHVKSIVMASRSMGAARSEAKTALNIRTGQRLEIVPPENLLLPASSALRTFSVYFEGKPLANSLVKAWHVQPNQTTVLHARSDTTGRVVFRLNYVGAWMVSTVHMTKTSSPGLIDWDSFWGNLTFYVPAK